MNRNPAERVLVVIPCLNEEAHLQRLIADLLNDPTWSDPLIVVADGGSTDSSRAIVSALEARDPRVKLLPNPGRLQSAGVNLAARVHGEGRRWLIRCDAHAAYPAGYVSALLDEAWRTHADAVAVPMTTLGRTLFERAAAAAQNSFLGTGGSAHRVGAPAHWVDHGHHALIDLHRFIAVGGYDESFSHNEDAEFDVRFRRAGGKIWLTDTIAITYHPRGDARGLARQYWMYGRGRARNLIKHRERPRLRQLAPLAVAPACIAAILSPALGAAFALPAEAWALACLAGGIRIAAREHNPVGLLAAPVAMLSHLAWSAGFWRQALATAFSWIAGQIRTPASGREAVRP